MTAGMTARGSAARDDFVPISGEDGSRRAVAGDAIFRVDCADPRAQMRAGRVELRGGDAPDVGSASLADFEKIPPVFEPAPKIPAVPGR